MRSIYERVVAVRVTADDGERIDALAERADGLTRAEVLRRALERGLALVERDYPKRARSGGRR